MDCIPTREEINIFDSLDERSACKHFLGKSLAEAEAMFRENSLYYQDYLFWMGPVAFRYYLSAAMAYMKSAAGKGDSHFIDGLVGTLELRLECEPHEMVKAATELKALCEFVLQNWEKFEVELRNYDVLALDWERMGVDAKLIPREWSFDLRTRYEMLLRRFSALAISGDQPA